MPGPRRKAPRQLAPQTIEEATNRLAEYADILLGVEELRQDADASIAAIEAERDRMTAPMEQRAKDLFLELRAWWGVAGDELTEGKRKSIELAGCQLGVRTTPPSLRMPGKAEDAVNILIGESFADLVRQRLTVDKPAVLKALGGDAGDRLRSFGFSAVQKDEFFIDRAGTKPAGTEEVADPAAS